MESNNRGLGHRRVKNMGMPSPVDTYSRTHTRTRVDPRTGAVTEPETLPTSAAGLKRAPGWVTRGASQSPLVAIEGVRSYGATFITGLAHAGVEVTELTPPGRVLRTREGKNDQIDSLATAQSVLPLPPPHCSNRGLPQESTPRWRPCSLTPGWISQGAT